MLSPYPLWIITLPKKPSLGHGFVCSRPLEFPGGKFCLVLINPLCHLIVEFDVNKNTLWLCLTWNALLNLSLPVFFLQIWIVLCSNILPKLICMSRESNPSLPRGMQEFYHWTTHAAGKRQNDSKFEIDKSKGNSKSDSKWCSYTQDRHQKAVSVFIVARNPWKSKWATEQGKVGKQQPLTEWNCVNHSHFGTRLGSGSCVVNKSLSVC